MANDLGDLVGEEGLDSKDIVVDYAANSYSVRPSCNDGPYQGKYKGQPSAIDLNLPYFTIQD